MFFLKTVPILFSEDDSFASRGTVFDLCGGNEGWNSRRKGKIDGERGGQVCVTFLELV